MLDLSKYRTIVEKASLYKQVGQVIQIIGLIIEAGLMAAQPEAAMLEGHHLAHGGEPHDRRTFPGGVVAVDQIEHAWQDRWEAEHVFWTPNRTGLLAEDPHHVADRPSRFVLDMFPYPSGVGLHVGHPLGFIATDVYARFQRMNGLGSIYIATLATGSTPGTAAFQALGFGNISGSGALIRDVKDPDLMYDKIRQIAKPGTR